MQSEITSHHPILGVLPLIRHRVGYVLASILWRTWTTLVTVQSPCVQVRISALEALALGRSSEHLHLSGVVARFPHWLPGQGNHNHVVKLFIQLAADLSHDLKQNFTTFSFWHVTQYQYLNQYTSIILTIQNIQKRDSHLLMEPDWYGQGS